MSRGSKWRLVCIMISTAVVLAVGCGEGTGQSALDPAGPAAESIVRLWWKMCAAFTAVFVLVLVLLLRATLRRPSAQAPQVDAADTGGSEPPLGNKGFIVAGGIVMPVVVLVPILLLSLGTSIGLRLPQDATTVHVVGHMWWWEVSYPDEGIVSANEIYIPTGKPVRLKLDSADVIHSFWVPRLHGKRDMIPGKTNMFWIQADEPGVYRGQCAEYCGLQHANMVLYVIALPPAEFRNWLDNKQAAAQRTAGADHAQGLEVFRTAGCAECHTIQGTRADGKAGPDLTHFGSRRAISGMLSNTRGNLAGWIADPQSIKPGAKMPRSYLRPEDLFALTDYLRSLE